MPLHNMWHTYGLVTKTLPVMPPQYTCIRPYLQFITDLFNPPSRCAMSVMVKISNIPIFSQRPNTRVRNGSQHRADNSTESTSQQCPTARSLTVFYGARAGKSSFSRTWSVLE